MICNPCDSVSDSSLTVSASCDTRVKMPGAEDYDEEEHTFFFTEADVLIARS